MVSVSIASGRSDGVRQERADAHRNTDKGSQKGTFTQKGWGASVQLKIMWLPPFVRNCTWHSYIQIKSTANIGESFDSFFCLFVSAGFGRAWPLLCFLTAAAAGFSFALRQSLRCFCVTDEAGRRGCFFRNCHFMF